jgi:hypothetical protein
MSAADIASDGLSFSPVPKLKILRKEYNAMVEVELFARTHGQLAQIVDSPTSQLVV